MTRSIRIRRMNEPRACRSDGAADEPSWLIASGLGESKRRNWALTSGLERSALRTSSGSGSDIVPTGPRGIADLLHGAHDNQVVVIQHG